MALLLIKRPSFETRRALLNRGLQGLGLLLDWFPFGLTAGWDGEAFFYSQIFDFLDNFQFVAQRAPELLNMLIFQLKNRLEVLNTVFVELLAIFTQINGL